MTGKVKCTCGWSWNKSDSSKKDMYICHECGRDNSNNMKDGGWLDNYNDSEVSLPEGFVGEGIFNGPKFDNPAWGGQFQMGGNLPGAVGNMYARTGSPSKGPRRNQTDVTDASAQNGKEMQYYQNGLDWKPKSISKNGGWLDSYDVAQEGERVLPNNNRALQILTDIQKRKQGKGKPSTEFSKVKIKDDREETVKKADNTRTASKPKVTDIKKLNVRNKTKAELAEQERKADEAVAAERKAVREKAYANPLYQGLGVFNSENQTRQNWEDSTAGLESKFRVSDEPNVFDDWINPASWIGRMAANLGAAPNQIVQQDSMMPLVSSIAEPVLGGAIGKVVGPYISKASKAITRPIIEPIKKSAIVRNITPKIESLIPKKGVIGKVANEVNINRNLNKIKKEGQLQGLSDFEIAKKQMEQVGITSNQRKGYTPIVSELAEKYITPYGYTGTNNGTKLSQTINNIKQGGVDINKIDPERLDAWKLYLGRPQVHKTFGIADTAPAIHPSYKPGSLEGMDIYNINSKRVLGDIPEYPSGVSRGRFMDILENPIAVDRERRIMGGYNKVMTKEGTQYNDVWDLDPHLNLKDVVPNKISGNTLLENIFYKTNAQGMQSPRGVTVPVSKVFGKPFMSHGNLPYSSTHYVDDLKLALQGEIESLRPIEHTAWEGPERIKAWEQQIENLKNYPKYGDGGIIKDDRGQWDHPGEITEINSNDITMEGVPYDVLGVSDTGDTKLMKPGKNYKFKGKKVTEYPMAKNGVNQQDQKTLQQLDQLTNFTNYNKPTIGGWLNKYN